MSFFSPAVLLCLVIIGAAIGFLSGLIGIGGGSLMIPVLLVVFAALQIPVDLAVKLAFGSNLLVGAVTAWAGFSVHRAHLTLPSGHLGPLAAASVVGALIGSTIASHVHGSFLKTLFGVTLLSVAAFMFFHPEKADVTPPPLSRRALIVLGLLVGVLASLVGLGGAVFTTIILTNLLHYPMRQAVGISTWVQIFGATFGMVGYMINGWGDSGLPPISLGFVSLPVAVAMAAGSVPCARLGARLTHRTPNLWLTRGFALLLILIAFRLLIR